ncbi:hypothetical protein ACWELV_12935 [Streptomyces mirabilis]
MGQQRAASASRIRPTEISIPATSTASRPRPEHALVIYRSKDKYGKATVRGPYALRMTMTPDELTASESTLELLNNEAAARLTRQADSLAKIDTKAVFLIGFAATAAQFLATHKHHAVLAYFAFAAYAVSLLAGMLTFRVAQHKDLEPRPMIVAHVRSPKSRALIELAASRAAMFEENKKRHDWKVGYWTASLWSLAAGLCLSTAALLLHA